VSEREIALRYGCNPHQKPARIYMASGEPLPLVVLNGSLSYINVLDALNSWQLVRELKRALGLPAAASFKHVSPAGAAVAVPLSDDLRKAYFVDDLDLSPLATAYARARGADRMSSYGDWVALSDVADVSLARLLKREVSDGIVAPGYEPEALEILKSKKQGNYPIVQIDPDYEPPEMEKREVFGVTLEQRRDGEPITDSLLENIVTRSRALPETARRDLIVATVAVKYAQSNSVCFALEGQVIGLGAGQQSRIHCTGLAAEKAECWYLRRHPRVLGFRFREGVSRAEKINAIDLYLRGDMSPVERAVWEGLFEEVPAELDEEQRSEWLEGLAEVCLSSDAFFPFRDNIDRAYRAGVRYVLQPGGSIRDEEVIEAANEYGMTMIFSGRRMFHH